MLQWRALQFGALQKIRHGTVAKSRLALATKAFATL